MQNPFFTLLMQASYQKKPVLPLSVLPYVNGFKFPLTTPYPL